MLLDLGFPFYVLFSEVRPPEIASWYIRSTPSGDMLHLLHKKGRRSDHLATSTLL